MEEEVEEEEEEEEVEEEVGGRKEGREQHDNCDTRAIQSAELHLSKVQKSSEATSLVRHSVRMRL